MFAQAAVVYVALALSPGITGDTFWTAFLAAWIVAIVGQLLGSIAGVDDENAFLAEVLRRGLRNPVAAARRTGSPASCSSRWTASRTRCSSGR